jgi:hypothetical protein
MTVWEKAEFQYIGLGWKSEIMFINLTYNKKFRKGLLGLLHQATTMNQAV